VLQIFIYGNNVTNQKKIITRDSESRKYKLRTVITSFSSQFRLDGVYSNITFPLSIKVFKPKGTLKAEDKYKTKIELASEIITELIEEVIRNQIYPRNNLW